LVPLWYPPTVPLKALTKYLRVARTQWRPGEIRSLAAVAVAAAAAAAVLIHPRTISAADSSGFLADLSPLLFEWRPVKGLGQPSLLRCRSME
jgi:hypothetical protein